MQARITIRIPQELEQQLKERAEMLGLSSAELTRSLIEQALEGQSSLPATHEELSQNLKLMRERLEAVLERFSNEEQVLTQEAQKLKTAVMNESTAVRRGFRDIADVITEHGAKLKVASNAARESASCSKRMTRELKLFSWTFWAFLASGLLVAIAVYYRSDYREEFQQCQGKVLLTEELLSRQVVTCPEAQKGQPEKKASEQRSKKRRRR